MSFRDKLGELNACEESLEWVGNKTIEQAWKTCKDSQWMIWILSQMDLDLTDPVCDMAEGVLDLVPEEHQLACIWAVSAARRRAKQDELDAAYDAAYAAANTAAAYAAADAASTYFFANYADYATRSVTKVASYVAADAAAAHAAAYADAAAADDSFNYNTAYSKEKKNQCDILRKYFTIDQVKEAFNKLVELNQN